jgi:polysaccharide export outer membrane protein
LALAALAFQAWWIDLAGAQTASKAYRISVGDKIGVSVFGQPDLSGEASIDQNGNIRLPMIGDISAINLTLSELEGSVAQALSSGYVRNPTVTARIAEYSPIYVLGLVRTPGLYPYREGLSVLGAIARAGGIGVSDGQQGAMLGALLQAEERIRLLEVSRVVLLAKRARLTALQNGDERIDFPDMSGTVDPARIAQIRDSEQFAFTAEREAVRQETGALEKQIPRLDAEIASLKRQAALELKQRGLNQELIADYEQLNKSGLARKSSYIEVRREEARIDGNIGRLESDALKAELQIGEVQFKIAELRNGYQRRVSTELRDAERSLMELAVSLPAAHRVRAAYARQAGMLTAADQTSQAVLTVIRAKGTTNVKYEAAVDFLLQPGDIVQIGSLFPVLPELDRPGASSEKAAEGGTSSAGVAPVAKVN